MDPTKPILDLYGESFHTVRQREIKPQTYKTSSVSTYQNANYNQNQSHNQSQNQYNGQINQYNPPKMNTGGASGGHFTKKTAAEASYTELEDKYQQLYQAYKDKQSKLSLFEGENDQLRNENSRLRDEIDRLNAKNQQLNSSLLSKNMQLEEAYRKLQEELRMGGNRVTRTNDLAIDKLEDGLREAITSNFQILRQSALSELKHFIH